MSDWSGQERFSNFTAKHSVMEQPLQQASNFASQFLYTHAKTKAILLGVPTHPRLDSLAHSTSSEARKTGRGLDVTEVDL